MNSFFSKYKNIFLIIIIAALLYFLYTYFFDSQDGDKPLVSSTHNTSQSALVGKEFLATLLELRSLDLDSTIFEERFFVILRDFSQEVEPQPAGRPNPFAEIGNDPAPIEENVNN